MFALALLVTGVATQSISHFSKDLSAFGKPIPDIVGEYSGAFISFENGVLVGKWKTRPDFHGEFNPGSNTTGYVVFPDDRKYTFEYDSSDKVIYWKGGKPGNMWYKSLDATTSGAPSLAGEFNGQAVISVEGSLIRGYWKGPRPDFKGSENRKNFGSFTFPDDQTYSFEYDPETGTIYWNGRESGNKWTKTSASALPKPIPEIVGEYPGALISFEKGILLGKWKTRPAFLGEFNPGSNTTGYVTFPDDRAYTFEYDSSDKVIYWEGRQSGNVWYKSLDSTASGVSSIAGEFNRQAVISVEGPLIRGYWKSPRPDFKGLEKSKNFGSFTFPDDQTYSFEYDPVTSTIYWDGRDSGNKWTKGKDYDDT